MENKANSSKSLSSGNKITLPLESLLYNTKYQNQLTSNRIANGLEWLTGRNLTS